MKSSTHETLSLQSFLRIYLWPSPIALLLVCAFIFRLFDLYDETRCLARVGAYLFIFFVILSFPKNKKGPLISGPLYGLEIALLTLVVAFALYQGTLYFSSQTDQLVKIDIGYYTQYSSQVFFRAHLNPYEGKVLINHLQDPQFSGYKHGPLMFLAYFASSYLPVSGLKVTNLVFLGLTAVMLIFLSWERHRKNLANIAMVMFSLAALFVSQRLWFELFSQGANDIFPILLVLAAFLLLRMKLWFFAGLLAGLSLSAKAAPGIVLTLLLIRKDFKPTYFLGVLAGLTPVLYFLWWNPQAMIKNYFIFHITKDYDTSSLYSVIP
ncbi:MAG: DUF2029 domain-containing protein, partial [Candidatus Omnitrophica bacterium]|nr:DUF2029 domain-containing protein [Candidatus Omnitrophota bacterium]